MFPDSAIAKSFRCGSDKVSYLSTFGLGPFFASTLRKKAQDSNGYVLLFDEALNRELGMKQLDMHIRMWDSGKVTTRFYNAAFMGHYDYGCSVCSIFLQGISR